MSTHDYNLANQSGASFRSDLNNALAAILSNNSNGSSPTTVVAYMIWVDTSANKLKIRNSANSAWIDLIDLDGDITRDFTFNGASANIVFDTSDNELNFKDNAKATFGNSADLTITHDGGSSIINDTGTGELLLQRAGNTMITLNSLGIVVQDPNGTAQVEIKGFEASNANVVLKCDEGDDNGDTWIIQSHASTNDFKILNDTSGSNSEKFAINTSGDLTVKGHISMTDNHEIRIGNGDDLKIFHTGAHSFIENSTGALTIRDTVGGNIILQGKSGEDSLICKDDAEVEIYFDNELRLETQASGCLVQRNTADSDVILHVKNQSDTAGADAIVRIVCENTTAHSKVQLGDGGNSTRGEIDYDHTADDLTFKIGNAQTFVMTHEAFFPENDNAEDLGILTKRFDDVFATNGTINTSDKNEKNTIVTSDLGLDFVNKLTPVSYKFNNKTRTHYGLIAQDIETVLSSISKTATDFAGFCKDQITTKTVFDEQGYAEDVALETPFDRYGLRYHEFIAPMIKAIQELSAKVTALEGS